MKFGVIVVLYRWNKNNLNNIDQYSKYFDEVILIDNSEEKIDIPINENYTYIALNDNFGIAYAINKGIEIARQMSVDYIITMDQDSSLKNNIVDIYKKELEKQKRDNVILTPSYEVEYIKNNNVKEYVEEINLLVQSGAMFPIRLFNKIGLFENNLFIDVVDYEFGLRARKLGVRILKCNKAQLKHNPGESTKKKILFKEFSFASHNPIRIYYQSRNLLWTSLKYKNLKCFKIYIRILMKIILLFDNKIQHLRMYLKGTIDGINNKLGRYEI